MKVRYTLIVLLVVFFQQILFAVPVRERVYLQTDKQTYLSGELIWMKFFLTDEKGIPASFSKIGYVELLDESTAQVQAKLDITQGLAEGWLEIPVTLPTGNYRLIAYTRNMRNESEHVFFHKMIGIINTFKTDTEIETDSISRSRVPEIIPTGNITVISDKKTYPVRTDAVISIEIA